MPASVDVVAKIKKGLALCWSRALLFRAFKPDAPARKTNRAANGKGRQRASAPPSKGG